MSILIEFLIIFAIILAASWGSPVKQKLSEDLLQPFVFNSSHPIQDAEKFDRDENSRSEKIGACTTEDCRLREQIYADAMNRNIDQYQNSYETWGGPPAEKIIPEYVQMSHQLNILTSSVGKRLKNMLESAPEVTEVLPVRQAKKFYQSCMDVDARRARGIGTIASILTRNGGWPMAMNIEDWKENAQSWQQVDENFTGVTTDYAFYDINFHNRIISEDSEDNFIVLQTPQDHFPQFQNDYEEYQSILQPLVELFVRYNQANVSTKQLNQDIHDLFIFEQKLRKVRKPNNIHEFHVMGLGNWILDWDYKSQGRSHPKAAVNWHNVIQHMFYGEKIEMDDHWQVMVAAPYYWSLIEIWNTTDERTIVNYIHWKFVCQAMQHIPVEIRRHLSVFGGAWRRLPNWLQCLQETAMHHANGYWFVKNYFGNATLEAIQKLIRNVKKELATDFEASNSISNDLQSNLKEKIEKMEVSLGFPDWYKNRTVIEYLYEGLTLNDDYMANILSFRRYQKEYDGRFFIRGKLNDGWTIALSEAGSTRTLYVMSWDIINIPTFLLHYLFYCLKKTE